MTLETTALDELNELVKNVVRHNISIPLHVQVRLDEIAKQHEADREQVVDAFKILLSEADDPNKPALIPSLIRRDYLPTE